MQNQFYIGTAGWSIPSQFRDQFQGPGTHLERYSRVFNCVEINSAFYRDHKPETYARWSFSVPEDFRFSVKLSKYFIHVQRLTETGLALEKVIQGISELGHKWGALLIQLPPSLIFHLDTAVRFVVHLRKYYKGVIIWEPRHISWASPEAIQLFADYKISKAVADPEPCPLSKDSHSRVESVQYWRLHGSPKMYESRYEKETLKEVAEKLQHPHNPVMQTWCIFDNTTFGYATENAIELQNLVYS